MTSIFPKIPLLSTFTPISTLYTDPHSIKSFICKSNDYLRLISLYFSALHFIISVTKYIFYTYIKQMFCIFRSLGVDHIPSELIEADGGRLNEEIHKLIVLNWNKEELPQEWK
jgi:hypothetical protein